jgi:hypothetical protein
MAFKFNPFSHKLDITGTTGGGGGGIDTLTGNSGGPVGPDGSGNVTITGSGGVLVSGNSGTNSFVITFPGAFFAWSTIVAPQMAVTFEGYFTAGGARVEVTLPAASSVGDTFAIKAVNSNGWKILQAGGQQINYGISSTTLGAGGSLASTKVGDTLILVCRTANTIWEVIDGIGSPTVV